MTSLVWDSLGEHIFQSGVSHGVLYLYDGRVAVWNGLTSVEEAASSELKSFYLDGLRYLEYLTASDFAGTLKAITYPDELDLVTGIVDVAPGLSYYDQPLKSFDLSYETRIGNDLDSELGYKIHLLYNILANPANQTFDTHDANVKPIEFSWALSGVPVIVAGHRPTCHVSVDSTKVTPDSMDELKGILYGNIYDDPRFPTIVEVTTIFSNQRSSKSDEAPVGPVV